MSKFVGLEHIQTANIFANSPVSSHFGNLAAKLVKKMDDGSVIITMASLGEGEKALAELRHIEPSSISSIEFDAVTFITGQNANRITFEDSDLNRFATTFAGQPFLRDHDHDRISSRDGTIMNSFNDNGEFVQRISITTDEGIRDFSQGRIDRFSIGMKFDEMVCSLCGNGYLSGECDHVRGQKLEDGRVCNIVLTNPQGIETSAVNVPAVSGTHILSIDKFNEIDKTKLEVIGMDDVETLDIHEENQEQLESHETPETEQVDDIAMLAEALHLGDIDGRLGHLEEIVGAKDAEIAELNAKVEELSHVMAQLNAELPPNHTLSANDVRPNTWRGYRGSVLGNLSESRTPEPKRTTRAPREVAERVRKEHSRKTRLDQLKSSKTGKNMGRKQVSGAHFLNSFDGGD